MKYAVQLYTPFDSPIGRPIEFPTLKKARAFVYAKIKIETTSEIYEVLSDGRMKFHERIVNLYGKKDGIYIQHRYNSKTRRYVLRNGDVKVAKNPWYHPENEY